MKLFLIGICTLICITSGAQVVTSKVTGPPTEKTLIADETWIVASGKSAFRVITSNDNIAYKIRSTFEQSGDITRFTYVQKSDRKGKYWERSFYFKNKKWNDIVLFINKLNKPK